MAIFRDPPIGVTLAWMALGVSLIAFAFTVHPVEASPLVFWALVGVGGTIVAVGGLFQIGNRKPAGELVGSECRRIYQALKTLLEEHESTRPRSGRFSNGRYEAWRAGTIERYEEDLQKWARKVFKQTVKIGVLSEASRPLLDASTVSQLANLRDLFRSAAEELEQRA
jgi:hypothetical protein